ncbi:MAG: NYN domain-containing protein [Tepidimonas taiwanensis]|nr:NYN domain-containing protein [Tepidimonas taiwanensis]
MTRVITYIDGFNLYFGLRSKGWRKYYWLDLHQLSVSLLKTGQHLVTVHYFTTYIRANGRNTDDMHRQVLYIEVIKTRPLLTLHLGHYLDKPRRCHQCGATWTDYEEKMTDVNIATQLLADAYDDRFDTALIISADSDLTTPVAQVRRRFPHKRVIIAEPPGRRSTALRQAASGYLRIGENKFRASQLPDTVQRADGFALMRPSQWR